ncbi:CBS domain-containing protein [Sphingomonas vulcanisoli]|uniref:CBS domain-containing protein n=1 Tax=Sphingomonas vulcanisoli TaxID=1658060 RepID=A0ABX0TP64_9SPHN|nr:CBS domain-containing protein [Sphingomonas vulcanisoli]NIJ07327.1 CBS domain-containing protein [Sphingomonas vulcanisoli]
MTIAALLRAKGGAVVHATPETSVRAVSLLLSQRRIGAVPVCDGDAIAGILSERDIVRALGDHGAEILDWPVTRLMTTPPITIGSQASLLAGLSLMTRRRIRHLPVVDGGKLVGIVSIGDLVKARIDAIENEAEAMRAYIAS